MKTFVTIIILVVVGVGAYMFGKQTTHAPQFEDINTTTEQSPNEDTTTTDTTIDEQTYTDPGPVTTAEEATLQYGQCPGFIVTSPVAGDTVTFPLTITGTVHPANNPGQWTVFEGEAGSVHIQDSNGGIRSDIIPLSLNVPWMNYDPKPFNVTIPALTSVPYTNTVNLVFKDNNPAGPDEGQSHECYLTINVQ